ncbi:MAG: ribonuclease III [Cyanobacteria bacterium J06621_8]
MLPNFNNTQLLDLALTHKSYVNEHAEVNGDYERLEFLGDAVLGFVIAEMLYLMYPEINEAQLTYLRSRLVDEKRLGALGGQLGLGRLMRLGKGAANSGGRTNPSLLNDIFEAMIGAYFLDSGIAAVKSYLLPIFKPLAAELVEDSLNSPLASKQAVANSLATLIDSKNRLQQWALAIYKTKPQYQIIAESGPDHAKQFTAQVLIEGQVYGTGTGNRKQEAEKKAAEAALTKIAAANSLEIE